MLPRSHAPGRRFVAQSSRTDPALHQVQELPVARTTSSICSVSLGKAGK
jgi:hypothetical protein